MALKPEKIKDGVHWVGVLNPDLRVFDVIMRTDWGTSYNSYLIQGKEKTALVDTVKDSFFGDHAANIRALCDPAKIDYIVINHTEPDHSGSLAAFLKEAVNATVVCSKPASIYLKNIVNEKFDCEAVTDGDEIDLGGKTLKFISVPFLHWPDSMFTYIVEDRILLSGDVFGFHFAADNVFDDKTPLTDEMVESQKYYFDVIMGPFKNYVLNAVKKARELDIDVIGPSHGPVLRTTAKDAVDRYEAWSQDVLNKNDPKKVYVGYVSCYGYTRQLAERIYQSLTDSGLDAEIQDISLIPAAEAAEKIHRADGFAIGSPTLNRDVLKPVWDVLTSLSAFQIKGKKAVCFGSFGWSGEATKYMSERVRNMGAEVVATSVAKLKPDDAELEEASAAGNKLAASLAI